VFRSLGSLSRAIGPVMGGLLYWKFGSSMPYWVGAAFLVVPFLMALGLPPVPESDEETVQP
jgi:predicted MFS family arabinose efflux permease